MASAQSGTLLRSPSSPPPLPDALTCSASGGLVPIDAHRYPRHHRMPRRAARQGDSFLRWEAKDYGDVLMAVGADRCSFALWRESMAGGNRSYVQSGTNQSGAASSQTQSRKRRGAGQDYCLPKLLRSVHRERSCKSKALQAACMQFFSNPPSILQGYHLN
jgi:hypothetical protein